MSVIDLSHPFTAIMPTYPGDPASGFRCIATIPEQGFTDHELKTGLHVGTHVDAPLHMIVDGKKITDYPSKHWFGRGVVVDAREKKKIDVSLFPTDPRPEDILLITTGWDSRYRTPTYFENYPVVTADFAQTAIDHHIRMIGIDGPSPDMTPYPIHKLLLGHDILIIENLTNLVSLLPYRTCNISALPINIDADAAPARVVAHLP